MTENIQSPQAKTLCALAGDDESTLQYPLPDEIFGFHAQQSCEKLFKALIAARGRQFPFTHRLTDLIALLDQLQESLPETPFDVLDLQPFAVQFRYTYAAPIAESERGKIRDTVVIFREYIIARILQVERENLC